jgi:hypothetical protein
MATPITGLHRGSPHNAGFGNNQANVMASAFEALTSEVRTIRRAQQFHIGVTLVIAAAILAPYAARLFG